MLSWACEVGTEYFLIWTLNRAAAIRFPQTSRHSAIMVTRTPSVDLEAMAAIRPKWMYGSCRSDMEDTLGSTRASE